MCGAYIGVDEYRSKLAVLSEKFAPEYVSPIDESIPPSTVGERSVWNMAL
jgi:trimethyllysine dioxygenase